MKVAIVYDRVTKFGGAERVLSAVHDVFPDAPMYTAVYDKNRATWAQVFDIRESFMGHIPLARTFHEAFPWLTPIAFESFQFDEFDLVISVTSAEAKAVVTKPGTLHICYCLTPTRYLWNAVRDYASQPGLGPLSFVASRVFHALLPALRRADLVASSRPDYYLAISDVVGKRIKEYYGRSVSGIVYPPVESDLFTPGVAMVKQRSPYFLSVGRMVSYKRFDLVVRAFNRLGWELIIIGEGRDKKRIERMANPNIHFIKKQLTDTELVEYYRGCEALVVGGIEDFGIVSLEAQACGKPVICYRESGMSETIVDGKTGILFDELSEDSLCKSLQKFQTLRLKSADCRRQAEKFSKTRFQENFRNAVGALIHVKSEEKRTNI